MPNKEGLNLHVDARPYLRSAAQAKKEQASCAGGSSGSCGACGCGSCACGTGGGECGAVNVPSQEEDKR